MKKLLLIALLCCSALITMAQVQRVVRSSLTVYDTIYIHDTICPEPPGDGALLLVWDDIANVPLEDCVDAPAPGNITITPDAIGDNPVTWYVTAVYLAGEGPYERSLFSDEFSFTIGDDASELYIAREQRPGWVDYMCGLFLGTTSETYTHFMALIDDVTADTLGVIFDEAPGEYDSWLMFDVHQDCTPGDPEDLTAWNTFFDLPTNGNPFTSVAVDGDTVKLYGGSGITLTNGEGGYACEMIGGTQQLFEANAHIVAIIDEADCVVAVADACFFSGTGEECTPVSVLETVSLPACETAGNYCFYTCTAATTFDLPLLTTAGDYCFSDCTAATTFDLSSCTDLGGTTGDDYVFNVITGNTITVTCHAALLTCNEGAPDGDLCTLHANNTITVNGGALSGCE